MKFFSRVLLFSIVCMACWSCGQSESAAHSKQEQPEMVKDNKAKMNKKMGANMKKTAPSKYWNQLATELKLDEDKLEAIRQLNNKNNKTIQALRDAEPEDLATQIKDIRIAEKKEVEKILGPALYGEKLRFDKKYEANRPNATPPKGMGGKK